MGQRFIEGTIPAVLGQIKRLNENLEKTLNQESDDKSDEGDE